ncbi:unnamed protein product [Blepharisma stoltei]|uniref:Uncharacterized protein n=1 Tax=Blepharisma stoltei TaxID=1481888 RepID=A0AAU9IP70_9CILI|nr:unnamed protein product [Blepharisma stoltei]
MNCIQAKPTSKNKNSSQNANIINFINKKAEKTKKFDNKGAKIPNNIILQLLIQRTQQRNSEDLAIKF